MLDNKRRHFYDILFGDDDSDCCKYGVGDFQLRQFPALDFQLESSELAVTRTNNTGRSFGTSLDGNRGRRDRDCASTQECPCSILIVLEYASQGPLVSTLWMAMRGISSAIACLSYLSQQQCTTTRNPCSKCSLLLRGNRIESLVRLVDHRDGTKCAGTTGTG